MKRRLSSAVTPVYKAVPLALAAFGVFRLLSDLPNISPGAIIILFSPCLFFYLLMFNLKSVYLEGRTLVVSDYLKVIRIPVSEVSSVTEWRGRRPDTITLKLRAPSAFGDKIVFVPSGGMRLAAELRELIGTCSRAELGEGPIGAAEVIFVRKYINLLRGKKR